MAPTAPPRKRNSLRSKTTSKAGSGLMARTPVQHRTGAVISDSFINSKADKRLIKHSAFINRIEKAHTKPIRRRRPNKKLVTTMEGLVDALPDVEELVKRKEGGKVEMKSLSHGKGFMKRRGKVEREERERFGKNLGVIMASSSSENIKGETMPVDSPAGDNAATPAPSGTASRFAAIRAWVNTNMEKHEGFEKKG